MNELVHNLVALDRAIMESTSALRWSPITWLFVLASAWWVKGPLFVAVGLVRDLQRRMVPLTALAVTAAFAAGDRLSGLIKDAVGRARPPIDDRHLHALVPLPASPSFPSGHATTAFAAACVVAVLVPRLRWPALGLAALVAISRVYLGVHFTFDVITGALLGSLVGTAIGLVALRLRRLLPEPPDAAAAA